MPRRVAGRFVALALLAALLAGCSDDGGGGAAGDTPEASVVGAPTGALESLTVEPGPHSVLTAVLRIEASEALPARVTAVARTGGGGDIEIPLGHVPAARHQELPLVGMRAESDYDVTVELVDGDRVVGSATAEVATPALPDGLPAAHLATSEPERMAPGITLFDIGRWGTDPGPGEPAGTLLGLDADGEVVWYYTSDGPVSDARMTPTGTIMMLYPQFGFREIDLLGNELRAWELGDGTDPGGPIPIHSDRFDLQIIHHEANPLPNGHILTISRRSLPLTPEERQDFCPGDPLPFNLADDVYLEVARDGTIVHQWALSDIVDPFEIPGTEICADEQDDRDWAHSNGIILDRAHNAVIVSVRHIDLLVAFRHEDDEHGPSGELLWSLGPRGTLPLDGEYAYHPHAPELEDDGTILLYDNGNHRPVDVPYSRAVRYRIDWSPDTDPSTWRATQVWEHRVDDVDGTPLYADFLGDADLLANGNVLIDHGGIDQFEPPSRGRIIEVVPHGAEGGPVVWDVSFDDTFVSYRAERLPSFYPTTPMGPS